MIALDSVTVLRGATRILENLTFSAGAEVTAIVGPSGSGKTTLLRVILGLESPCAGRVSIDGRILNHDGHMDVLPEERNVAMVFQDLALWPHLTVQGNLDFGLRARGLSKTEREQRISEALSWVGLGGKASRRPHDLSGGEQQRVAIARALVLDPVALLLDEPLGSLDVALKNELLGVFARVFAERRLPVLYITHDPREAARLAQCLIVIEGGHLTQQGPPDELDRAPATPFIKTFMHAMRAMSE